MNDKRSALIIVLNLHKIGKMPRKDAVTLIEGLYLNRTGNLTGTAILDGLKESRKEGD